MAEIQVAKLLEEADLRRYGAREVPIGEVQTYNAESPWVAGDSGPAAPWWLGEAAGNGCVLPVEKGIGRV